MEDNEIDIEKLPIICNDFVEGKLFPSNDYYSGYQFHRGHHKMREGTYKENSS